MAVFAGSRIRDNNVFGTITDNPLTNVATTMNSAGLANLSAISGNHAVLILDPLRVAGAPEIIIMTAHTGAATSGAITRGAYGTAARQHASGTLWVQATTMDDLIRIVTSGTRPSDQYEGQLVFETDTDYFMGHNGTAWEHGLKLGAWQTYTPTWTNVTLGTGSTVEGAYVKAGRTVFWRAYLTIGTGGSVSGNVSVSLPVTAAAGVATNLGAPGLAIYDDFTGGMYPGGFEYTTTTVRFFAFDSSATYAGRALLTAAIPFTWAVSDKIRCSGFYEAAA